MAKTVIHLPPQITSRSKEKKNKSALGWSRERLQHLLSIKVTAKNNRYLSYFKLVKLE